MIRNIYSNIKGYQGRVSSIKHLFSIVDLECRLMLQYIRGLSLPEFDPFRWDGPNKRPKRGQAVLINVN